VMVALNQPPESRFAYVVIAARRARQLMLGAGPLIANPHSLKYTRIAMEELNNSVLEFDIPAYSKPEEVGKRRKG